MSAEIVLLIAVISVAAGAAVGAVLAVRRARSAHCRADQLQQQVTDSRRMAYVGRLTSGLAHEIKNPLSTLNLNLQLLAEDLNHPTTETERRTARKLEVLQHETRRLEEILDDFLRFAGRMELQKRRIDAAEMIRDLLAFYEPQAAQKGITVRETIPDDLPPIEADADLLKQAMLNIILNAQAAMSEGGELMVAARAEGGTLAISITDTGSGIPEDRLGRIFEAYYSSRPGGTGLGLPTVKRIVAEHGGTIEVTSDLGRGTQFVIRLPALGEKVTEGSQ
ncbi:MAG: two-component sensor histidine kinase [Anaerolineaceae bacterium]|nr:two-component sensor histidine kinase [Anaerolineaceae bacterium]